MRELVVALACLLVIELACFVVLLWWIDRSWRPMIRGYLEHRAGEPLPDASPIIPDKAGRVRFPEGDNSDLLRFIPYEDLDKQ